MKRNRGKNFNVKILSRSWISSIFKQRNKYSKYILSKYPYQVGSLPTPTQPHYRPECCIGGNRRLPPPKMAFLIFRYPYLQFLKKLKVKIKN